MGFGNGVVQRLCKTSVKKNLYWEIKDRVVEETFNGVRMEKRPRRVKIYGLDSNREVRARLIEILYDRVKYHKDKFICPILHDEMQHMEVKKSGKVEHSSNTHDDQVFSYLMALYVWYDGHDLMENWGIQKNTLKTDDDKILEDGAIEELEDSKRENLDLNQVTSDEDDEISRELDWIEKESKVLNSNQFRDKQYLDDNAQKEKLIQSNKIARLSYSQKYGIDMDSLETKSGNFVSLPDDIYGGIDVNDDTDDGYNPLQGNLSNFWNKL